MPSRMQEDDLQVDKSTVAEYTIHGTPPRHALPGGNRCPPTEFLFPRRLPFVAFFRVRRLLLAAPGRLLVHRRRKRSHRATASPRHIIGSPKRLSSRSVPALLYSSRPSCALCPLSLSIPPCTLSYCWDLRSPLAVFRAVGAEKARERGRRTWELRDAHRQEAQLRIGKPGRV
ncbi:hypothetical protein C8R45DRAFT_1047807, partial [Mycena sanguinolenta]